MKKPTILMLLMFLSALITADDFLYHGSFLWNDIRDIRGQDNLLYCAFYEGVGTINLDLDHYKKRLYSHLELDGIPLSVHPFGDILAARTESGRIYLIDISNPAQMKNAGSFMPEWEIWDIDRLGNYIYIAVEYSGVARYDISDPDNIHFDDSSMAGIRVTALDIQDTVLYVLDDYNGLLLYIPDSNGFGDVISELLLPEQAISLTVDNDSIYAGVRPNGYLIGSVKDISNPEYIEKRESFIRGDEIAITENGLILSNNLVGFELIYENGGNPIDQIFFLENTLGYGQTFYYDGYNYIAYPHLNEGFRAYVVDDPLTINVNLPNMAYGSPGPITQIQFVNSRLHTLGPNNRYEIYDLSNPGNPQQSGKFVNPPYQTAGMFYSGDTIFVADIKTTTIFPAIDYGMGDPHLIRPFYSFRATIGRPFLLRDYFGDGDLIYYKYFKTVRGVNRQNNSIINDAITWNFEDFVTAVLIDDTIVYRAGENGGLQGYLVNDDYTLELQTDYSDILDLSEIGVINDLLKVGDLLYAAGNGLKVINISNPLFPHNCDYNVQPGKLKQLKLHRGNLYCAGDSGIFIYDISTEIPELLFSGGSSATILTIDNDIIAASDGKSVKIYSLSALDMEDNIPLLYTINQPKISGYPNPFNPEITLSLEYFSGFKDITVEIFDILGRKIRTLIVNRNGPGQTTRSGWDGCDENGHPAATGVYLFKAASTAQNAFFKAVLVK